MCTSTHDQAVLRPSLTDLQIVALREARGDLLAPSPAAAPVNGLVDRIHLNALGLLDRRQGGWTITCRGRTFLDQVDRREPGTADAGD